MEVNENNRSAGIAGADKPGLSDLVANPPDAAKRGRGRPAGSKSIPAAPAAAVAAPAAPVPSIWNLENSRALARIPASLAAVLLDEKEIALTETELNELTPALLEVLRQFAPAAGAKYAAVIALTASAGAIASNKAPIVRAALKRRLEKKTAEAKAQEEKK